MAGTLARFALGAGLLALAAPAPAREAEIRSGELPELDRRIEEVEGLIRSAHFQTALALSRSALAQLDASDRFRVEGMRRSRLWVLRATAEVALDRRRQARESMRQALQADPGLVLDQDEASPKLLGLLRQARQGAGF